MRSLNILLLIGSFSITIFSSCSVVSKLPVFYTPAATSNHMAYLPKPMMADSVKSKNYISASFANNSLPFETGEMVMGFVNYNRSHVIDNINFSYGAFTYFGGTGNGYENAQRIVLKNFYDQGFIGLGARTSIGIAERSGNTEFRIISWDNAIVYEGGGYSSFRKNVRSTNDSLSISANQTTMFTTGGSTEIIWQGSKNKDRQYGFRLFIGSTIGLKRNINYTDERISGLATDLSFFLKIRKVYGIFSNGTNLRNNSAKITLGYSF